MASRALAATFAMPVEEFPNSSRRYAWYVAGLLTITQIVSYIDRFLPSLLIQPIKNDLDLTDFQVGLLLGPAFGIFYVFVGIPIGWLADRRSRRAILSIGISVWCAMTAAAGLVRGFAPLFVARLGVGLGEATVAPCTISLLSDYFPRSKRNRALSLFMAGTFLGAGAAFLFGGPIVHSIALLPPLQLPGIGTLTSWQMSFLIIGVPGFALALLMFTIREPIRQDQVVGGLKADPAGPASLRAALAFILQRWKAFGALFVGSAAVVTMGSLVFWNVALFERVWHWHRDGIVVPGRRNDRHAARRAHHQRLDRRRAEARHAESAMDRARSRRAGIRAVSGHAVRGARDLRADFRLHRPGHGGGRGTRDFDIDRAGADQVAGDRDLLPGHRHYRPAAGSLTGRADDGSVR